jgi:hypothetical protein
MSGGQSIKLTLLQRDGRQDGVLVDNRSVVDLLVNGDGGVNVGALRKSIKKVYIKKVARDVRMDRRDLTAFPRVY